MSSYTAVLDACVLYPAPLRDLLLQLTTTGLFCAKWTDRIHEEWMGALLRSRKDLFRPTLERTRTLMDRAVPDCLVTDYEDLIPAIDLSDLNDRHVLAAAVKIKADVIVTFNLTDFPAEALRPYDIEALHPDDFVRLQSDLDEAKVVAAAKRCRQRLRNPAFTAEEYLRVLESQGLASTVQFLFEYKELL